MSKRILISALIILPLVFLGVYKALALPTGPGGVGSGALSTDASNNLGTGVAPISGTKFTIQGATSDGTTFGLKILNSGGTPVFTVTSNGAITISSTTNVSASGIRFADNSYQTTAYTGSASNPVTIAGNVGAGAFGSNTGGGNYSFPASVGIGTTAPDTLFHVVGAAATTMFLGSTIAGDTLYPLVQMPDQIAMVRYKL